MAKFETIPKQLRTPELEKLFAENEVTICARFGDCIPGETECNRRDKGAGFFQIGALHAGRPDEHRFCCRIDTGKETAKRQRQKTGGESDERICN